MTIELDEYTAEYLTFTLQDYLENAELVDSAKEMLQEVLKKLEESLA